MLKYQAEVKWLAEQFNLFQIQRIPRSRNKQADARSKLASSSFNKLSKTVLIKVLTQPSYQTRLVYPVDSQQTQISTIIDFLDHGNLLADQTQAQKIQRIAPRYTIFNGTQALYKRSYQGPRLKCITSEGVQILQDLYKGICRAHSRPQAPMRKAMILGYFWPTPTREIIPISSPQPFKQWILILLGLFLGHPGIFDSSQWQWTASLSGPRPSHLSTLQGNQYRNSFGKILFTDLGCFEL